MSFRLLLIFLLMTNILYAQDAKSIIQKAEQKVRGNSSFSTLSINVIRPSWKRTIILKAWTRGTDYALMLIEAPASDKGTVFLKRLKEIWNWVPSIERTIKFPPSMMQQSWMGTDFTNDDLVKADSYVNDYTQAVTGDSTIEGRNVYKIQLLPKPEAGVVWGKVIVFVDKKDFLELRLEFYDEDGNLVNVMNASDIKDLGGRILPSRLEMIPMDKKGYKTVLMYKEMAFDKPISESFFTLQNMQKVR
ncbi:MAG TPA: outer membrane lipoprotein-sorting protein [Chitinophagaceae bacterium]